MELGFFEEYDYIWTDKEQIEICFKEDIKLHRQIIELFETNN